MVVVHGQVDSYRVESRVARGRSGEVFLASAGDGSPVALKVHDRSEDALREAERLAQCDHPAVVRSMDEGRTADGRLWLALPWIEGRTLSRLIAEESPLPGDRVVALVAQLGQAVDALHQVGIVHGDLSPNNVLVDETDRLTVIDLGAAGTTSEAVEQTTGVEVATTPRYASPEVARGESAGPAADRYAVGLVAYEALTGAFPFPDVATPIAMLSHHASSVPVAASEHRPDLSGAVDALLARTMAKDGADRPASGVALADELRAALDARPNPVPRAAKSRSALRVAVPALLTVGALIAAVTLWPERSSPLTSPTSSLAAPVEPQPIAGGARGLSCNLLQDPDFEGVAVTNDFYGGDPSNTVAVADGAGVGGSGALRVGADDRFGLHAEIVPVGSHDRFVFSAWVRHDGGPDQTAMYVDYLDEDFVQLTAVRDVLRPGTLVALPEASGDDDVGFFVRVERMSEVAPEAVYAVPTFFKSGSTGSLLVDEVVFGPVETCPDLAS